VSARPGQRTWRRLVLPVLVALGVVLLLGYRIATRPDVHETAWSQRQPAPRVTGGGYTLHVAYRGGPASGPCRTTAEVEVTEDVARVVVTVTLTERRGSGDCSGQRRLRWATARLDSPVGDRRLVDGSQER
jgi:hypothetical protein